MRLLQSACLVLVTLANVEQFAVAKQYSSSRAAGRPRSSSGKPRKAPASASRRPRYEEEEEDEEEDDFAYPEYEDEEEDEEYEEEEPAPRRKPSRTSSSRSSTKSRPKSSRSRSSRSRFEEDEEDYYDDYERPSRRRGPPPSRRDPRGGRVVQYQRRRPAGPSAFTRSLSAIRDSMPDPTAVRDVAVGSLKAARETSSKLTANLYREVKGLTSSELEQVMLKATRPDDTVVKGKHVERLVGVTYQVSARYDLYTGVLRKLWAKVAEKDCRTKIKALYILHRYSADGAPEHKDALIKRLRELRRTPDPKRKGKKYFNKEQLLMVENTPENQLFRSFVGRYAHYVLARAQSFGGVFVEIGNAPNPPPKKSGRPPKPLTATSLKQEHLVNAKMVLNAGLACQLKDDEVTENTAIAAERVASDMIALSSAVAMALNRALKGSSDGSDPMLLKKWCEFYSEELLPQTVSMVKKTSPKLDPYGIYLPSRMGTRVAPELLQKGLKAVETEAPKKVKKEETEEEPTAEKTAEKTKEERKKPEEPVDDVEDADEDEEGEAPEVEMLEEDEYDEYEYDEDEYYDDGEEL